MGKADTAHTPGETHVQNTGSTRSNIWLRGAGGLGVTEHRYGPPGRGGWPPGPGREAPRRGNGGTSPQEQDTPRGEGFKFSIGVEI